MARKLKVLLDEAGNDTRELGYYSTPEEVSHYIQESILKINPHVKLVLDPAVGREELIDLFIKKGIPVDGYDIAQLKSNYNSNFQQCDFIEYVMNNFNGDLFSRKMLPYDAIIMNPPYNCHEVDYIKKNKSKLVSYFNTSKALNMYSMFMDAVISNAKSGAVIGMIVSDSFMTNKLHKPIREIIKKNCKIHKIILCPSNLFWVQKADVRTCILILEKNNKIKGDDNILTMQRFDDLELFYKALKSDDLQLTKRTDIFLDGGRDNDEIIIGVPKKVLKLFSNPRLGDIYPCITGISTGNDKKYLSSKKTDAFPHPFYKNPGSQKFYCDPQNYLIKEYLEISKVEKTLMVRNKKFIGEEGITCSSMGVRFSACHLPKNSTFGVNSNIFPPRDDIGWLCCYLNSSLVQFILRAVIVRSNMVTSGYVSRIPLIDLSISDKNKLTSIFANAQRREVHIDKILENIDKIIFSAVKFDLDTEGEITSFCRNLYRKT